MNAVERTPAWFDLEHLRYPGMVESGRVLRRLGDGAVCRQQAAERVVAHFYDAYRVPQTGERAFVLARCFQTCGYARLPLHYRDAADKLLDLSPSMPELRCLALLATRGEKALWNDPATSVGHQAIPLPSVEVVRQAPMISRLLDQLGMPIESLVAPVPEPEMMLHGRKNFNVFHVPRAAGSQFIPAQDGFVKPYGVRSVLGMGGLLPNGEFFAVILFARVVVSREVAMLFRTLALSVKLALLPFGAEEIFDEAHR